MGIARTQFVILIMAFFTQIWILIFLLGLHTYVCDGAKGCSMTAAQGGCTNPADTHCRLRYDTGKSKCDGTNKCKVADPVCAFALFEGKEGWHPNGTNHGCVTKGKNVVGTCTGTNFCILQPKNGAIDSSVCTAQCPSAQKQKPAEVPDPSPSGPTSSGSSLCYRTILLVIISLLYI